MEILQKAHSTGYRSSIGAIWVEFCPSMGKEELSRNVSLRSGDVDNTFVCVQATSDVTDLTGNQTGAKSTWQIPSSGSLRSLRRVYLQELHVYKILICSAASHASDG